jgi:phosphatidylserine decarboxylase
VKGIDYSLESLLPEIDTARFHNGAFAIFFLSPADCHRVFAPGTGAIHEIRHIPGRRLPVHPPYQRREFPVFTLNERVILSLTTSVGACALVMVAGWGVGNITHPFDTALRISHRRITRREFTLPRRIDRGEWIGTFELGSTVILIAEANGPIVPLLALEDRVVYGQPAFSMRAAEGGNAWRAG